MSITVSLSVAELISRAAEYLQVSEPMLIIGATLAHVGRLQRFLRVDHAETLEEARAIRTALQQIELPRKYRYSQSLGRPRS